MRAFEFVNPETEPVAAELAVTTPTAVGESTPEEAEAPGFAGIIGRHRRMQAVFDVISRVAGTNATVLITGESGTGKELVAQAIHTRSRRRLQRLVPVHCGAIPEDLLESEMFGHERGAFTGAICSRIGRFRLADGGTIFLDEIGDMSPKLQVKLLRVLENGMFEPVGGVTTQCVDVRIIAATNRNLEEAVADRRFREDLYYRLRVVPVEMPTLRERREDIPLLVEWFLGHLHTVKGLQRFEITDDALGVLSAYHWPGNVRELKNLLEQLVVLGDADRVIRPESLPPQLRGGGRVSATGGWTTPPWDFDQQGIDFYREMASIEDRIIARALHISRGNKKEAARLLHLNRTTLLEKLKRKREAAGMVTQGEPNWAALTPLAVTPTSETSEDFRLPS
ncbi:MAG: sigma-54-dependent Fis family transcriptional regulator [Deltaproteobacteria bacterium]|nr:sigma-54-dependent Fis family transcriptional regulator [Deltaproteobacteria bacterium]